MAPVPAPVLAPVPVQGPDSFVVDSLEELGATRPWKFMPADINKGSLEDQQAWLLEQFKESVVGPALKSLHERYVRNLIKRT